jgi:hypothetical protein
MTDDTAVMTKEVENYVYIRTGKRVKIVFNDSQSLRKHLILLGEAYAVAMYYNNHNKTFK